MALVVVPEERAIKEAVLARRKQELLEKLTNASAGKPVAQTARKGREPREPEGGCHRRW